MFSCLIGAPEKANSSDFLGWLDQKAFPPAPVVIALCDIHGLRPPSGHHRYTSDCHLRLYMLNFEVSVLGIG